MKTKLLIALALVGAMHAGEPAAPDKAYLVPTGLTSPIATLAFSRDVIFHGPRPDESRWLVVHADPDCRSYEDAYAPAKVKLTVTREPTVTRKADGSWEITFAGKAPAASGANTWSAHLDRIEALIDKRMAELRAVTKERDELKAELEAANKIIMPPYPPLKPTVEWIGSPMVSDNDRYTPSQSWISNREFGLRSDGCVVWRERK